MPQTTPWLGIVLIPPIYAIYGDDCGMVYVIGLPTLYPEIDRKNSSILESTCIKFLGFDGDDPSIIEVLNYLNTMDIYIYIMVVQNADIYIYTDMIYIYIYIYMDMCIYIYTYSCLEITHQ